MDQIVLLVPQAQDIQHAPIIAARALCHVERLVHDAIVEHKRDIRL